jgi:hypothetical protein
VLAEGKTGPVAPYELEQELKGIIVNTKGKNKVELILLSTY